MTGSRSALHAASALLLIGLALPAIAADPSVVTQPDWVRKPSQEELHRVWPGGAAKKGIDGSATISCLVNAEGALYDCGVVAEKPADLGFGAAALALAPAFRMRPATRGGAPVAGGTVRIPINWHFDGPMQDLGIKVVNNVPWRKAPTADQLLESYPEKARKVARSGRAMMTCAYLATGRLRGCETDFEDPKGFGFATAAKTLAPLFEGPPLDDKLKREQIRAQIQIAYPSENLSGGMRVGKPKWLAFASMEDLLGGYPEDAKTKGIGARVVLDCHVADGGVLADCSMVSEEPANMGFGAAAVKLAPSFRMTLWTDEGLPTVGADIRVPLRYQVKAVDPPGDAPPPAKP